LGCDFSFHNIWILRKIIKSDPIFARVETLKMDTSKFRKVERAIQNFQNNDECRVFLISLKTGVEGLNLIAADYVYIVDP
jgi:SNF2 family DNA or RNA helicase